MSPTNREIAEQMERKPIAVSTVKTRVKVLLEEGWLVKIKPKSLEPLESLLTAEDYASLAAGAS
ncbi:MAG: hypothetical protein IID33_06195 [Planctomycetes bacterium]|nr:hypothetical protein [Planctomycetota bacterium]